MRILVTGHRGHVGGPAADHLERLGHEVAGFDRVDGDDLLDPAAVRRAADGRAAIVHLGAIANDNAGSPEEIMAVNVLGTWHVLLAAEAAAVERVVCFSSMQVLGIAGGERLPDYFPVDDEHPRRTTRPYGLSKRLGEDLRRRHRRLYAQPRHRRAARPGRARQRSRLVSARAPARTGRLFRCGTGARLASALRVVRSRPR